jgi:radical SAM protein
MSPAETLAGPHPPTQTRPRGKPELFSIDFDERPFTVAWELTRACALACVHCRAEAQPKRHPDELTTAESYALLDRLAELAPPVLVLTGGDPMMRPDLFDLVEYAIARGLRVAVSPTTTALPTRARLERLRDLGVAMIHVSIDGADAETHDTFRGVDGTFARAMRILEDLQALEMPTQVGTTITRHNIDQMEEMAALIGRHGVRVWNVFYLVPTGRGKIDAMIDVERAEASWDWLAALSERSSFAVRTTAAPQFRRTMLRRARAKGEGSVRLTGAGYQLREAPDGIMTKGVNDAKGFMFIDHVGNICPSGFLQVPGGNVRTDDVATVYRSSELFRALRDPSALQGRCGRCEFADLCGGSRARAMGVSGNYLAEDPLCSIVAADRGPSTGGSAS